MKSANRLSRLLNLVPYLLARPGISLAEAAADLQVTEAQLRDDLQLLFLCGLPGYGPGDLIDISLAGDSVTVTYDAGMNRPLRLTADEAIALIVALRALAEVPGLAAGDVVEKALAKVEEAAGDAAEAAARVAVRTHADEDVVRAVSGALERGRALRITYYTAARDALTERVVDPLRLVLVSGNAYMEAWCREAEGRRLFRVDRIDALTELDEPAAPPRDVGGGDVRDGLFHPTPDAPLVTLSIGRNSRWVTEYYPCESVTPRPDGRRSVSLRASNLDWARRLVMALGPDVVVESPAELREQVAASARAALARYAVGARGSG